MKRIILRALDIFGFALLWIVFIACVVGMVWMLWAIFTAPQALETLAVLVIIWIALALIFYGFQRLHEWASSEDGPNP